MPETLPPLFYHADELIQGEEIVLAESESRHITGARRLVEGEVVYLTNGRGMLADCVLLSAIAGGRQARVRVRSVQMRPQPSPQRVLASAVPRGERQSVMLDMATQLGMNVYVPLNTRYSATRHRQKMNGRWHRVMVSACKQSRQCHFPEIAAATDVRSLVDGIEPDTLVCLGEAGGQSLLQGDQGIMRRARKVIAVVGPEGGFSDEERVLLAHPQVIPVAIGKQVLRTETAAVALLAAINQFIS